MVCFPYWVKEKDSFVHMVSYFNTQSTFSSQFNTWIHLFLIPVPKKKHANWHGTEGVTNLNKDIIKPAV